MKSYEGKDAVAVLCSRIEEYDLSGQSRTLMKEFISWVKENESPRRVIPVLYAWYQMLEHIDFDLAAPSSEDLEDLLDRADDSEHEEWNTSLELFYDAFLQDAKGKQVDINFGELTGR